MKSRACGRYVAIPTSTIIAMLLWTFAPTPAGAFPNIGCNYRDSTFNGEIDFGFGNHSLGSPAANANVTWSFTSVNNAIVRTARVRGTLYLDRVGSGQSCPRLRINFQDSAGNNLEATQDIAFCGPGNNANLAANQRAIDVTNVFPSAQLRRVQLTLGQGSTLANTVDLHTGLAIAPSTDLALGDIINSGEADFGFRPHSGGAPQTDGDIDLGLRPSDGVVFGRVNGILFWDALFGDGTARAITDFQQRNGTILETRITTLLGTGCCATDTDNQTLVDHRSQNTELFKIRLRVGRVSSGSFVGVTSRTYSFGCGVGTVEGFPVDTTIRVGEDTVYGVEWTVPDPENWHSLNTLDIRLIEAKGGDGDPKDKDSKDEDSKDKDPKDEDAQDEVARGEILRLRWDEAANTFSKFDPHTEQFINPGLPGSSVKFESPAVTVFLKDSEVIGSGPTGPSVRLNLHFKFKPRAARRTFTVQVRATDDSGLEQGWDSAGEITVLPRGKVKQVKE